MRKLLSTLLLMILCFGAKAQEPYSMMWNQIGVDQSTLYARFVPFLDGGYCVVYLDGTATNFQSRRPRCAVIGSGLMLSGGTLSSTVTTGPEGPQGPQGVQGIQGQKGDTGSTGAAGTNGTNALVTLTTTGSGAATYNAGTGALNIPTPSIPTVPVINRTRVTTAADGSYSWTLPTACASGTTPVVSITPESSTANDAISHRVVSVTNTTVNVFAGRSAGLTVLSLTVLGVPAGAAIPLHLIAICP